jgi:hypothetical protein
MITRETTQFLLGTPLADPFAGVALAEEDDDDDPNGYVFAALVLEGLRHKADEAREPDAQEEVSLEGSHRRGA